MKKLIKGYEPSYPDSDKMKFGEIVNIITAVDYDGYTSTMTITEFIKTPDGLIELEKYLTQNKQ